MATKNPFLLALRDSYDPDDEEDTLASAKSYASSKNPFLSALEGERRVRKATSKDDELERMVREQQNKKANSKNTAKKKDKNLFDKTVDVGEGIGRFFFKKTAELGNLGREGLRAGAGGLKLGKESLFGDDESYEKTLAEVHGDLFGEEARQRSQDGGFLGAGTGITNERLNEMGGTGRMGREIVGRGALTASEIVPFGRAYKAATAAKAGSNIVKRSAIEGAGTGLVTGVAGQIASDEDFNFGDVGLSTVLGGLMGGAGAKIGSRFAKNSGDDVARGTGKYDMSDADRELFGGIDEGADDVLRSANAEDRIASELDQTNKPLMLGDGMDPVRSRLEEIDAELSALQRGEVDPNTYSTNPEDVRLLEGERLGMPREEGGQFAGGRQGVMAETRGATLTDTTDTVEYAKNLMRERDELTEQLTRATTPNEPANLAEAVGAAESPDMPTNTQTTTKQTTDTPTEVSEPFSTPGERYNSPGTVKRITTSVQHRLSSIGGAGKTVLANGLNRTYSKSRFAQSAFMKKVPTVTSLKGKEFTEFVDALEAFSKGETPKLSDNVQKAVDEWKAIIPSVRQAAEKAGIDVGDLGEYYFPKSYKRTLAKKENFDKAVKHLVDTKQAKNTNDAIDKLEAAMEGNSSFGVFDMSHSGVTYGHLEKSRVLDLPMYDKDKDALVSYVQSAMDRISHAEEFGAKNEKALEAINQIKNTKGQRAADEAFKQFSIGSGEHQASWTRPEKVLKTYSGIKAFNRLKSLDLAAILNSGQSTNTATVTGFFNTAKSALKALSKEEREYVRDTGVIIDSVLQQMRDQTGNAGKITGKLTAPAFNTIEKFNRSVAAVAGKNYAAKLAKKGDEKSLAFLRNELGIEGPIGKKLTRQQELKAGQAMADLTQFNITPKDLPGWASSPEGKLVSQFRTFGYKQTGFMYNQVFNEAKQGNFLPLVRFLAVGTSMGYVLNGVKNKIRPDSREDLGVEQESNGPDSLLSGFLKSIDSVGGFGLGSSVVFPATKVASDRFPQYLGGTIGGPTVGNAIQTATNVSKAAGGDVDPLVRQGASIVPFGERMNLAPYDSPLSDKQEGIVREGAGEDKQRYYDFFTTAKGIDSRRDQTLKKVREALDDKSFNKSKRIADQHNAEVLAQFQDYIDQYGLEDENVMNKIKSYLIPVDTPSMVAMRKRAERASLEKEAGRW